MTQIKKTKITSYRKILFHIAGWSMFLTLHYLLLNSVRIRFVPLFHILQWLIYILLFYLTYLLIIPQFLFKKKHYLFAASMMVLILLGTTAINIVDQHFRPIRFNMPVSAEKNIGPPPPDKFMVPEKPMRPKFNIMALYNVLLYLSVSTAIRFSEKWNKDEKQKTELDRIKAKKELNMLKNQVNPHFLFNSLNSIYSLANRNSTNTTQAIMLLSNTLRYMLYDIEKNTVVLNSEIEHIHNYIELQKLRLTNKTSINFDVSGDPDNYRIEPLLLIPFVENAFKFGADNYHKSFINIQLQIIEDQLLFTVKNRIVNRRENSPERSHSGIGLLNVCRQLEILYPDQHHSLDITESDGEYSIALTINLKS